jgi:YHS domain-containing protein
MKKFGIIISVVAFGAMAAWAGTAKDQSSCPYMGSKAQVKDSVHASCCAQESKGKCDTTKAIKDAAKAKVQTNCPVMGGKINKDIYTDYKGKRVYFCCGGCPSEFKKNPEKYMKKL